jgi:ppGpp synthetase/RelA/SpoT-type nucleotidyltranferase
MIYPSILDRKYKEYRPFIEEVARRVKETLLNFCDSKGYPLTSRIKTIESLAEKIETGRFKRWSELDDLFACTVILPTLSHEEEVMNFCKSMFEIVSTTKRGQNKKSPDTFRFDSSRIYARLKNTVNTEPDNILNIYKIKFEIQIKSAFEHAWSVSTHDLVYKSGNIDWKKLRLAAQMKATVEQLDMLILAFEQNYVFIEESDYPEIKIKYYLAAETNKLFETKKLPDELKPKDVSRFCDNLYRLLEKVGNEKKIKNTAKEIFKRIRNTPNNRIPLSLSLFQYFVAILVSEEIIDISSANHCFHITSEVITLYPSLQDIDSIFEYDEDS